MKKMIKKLSALLMAVVMVLAMSATAFAAEATASITINNLTPNDNTVVKIYKVVSHSADKSNWVVEDWAKDYVTDIDTATAVFDWNGLKDAVADGTIAPTAAEENITGTTVTFDGLEVGAYLVIATGTNTTYNVMGAATYGYDENNNLIEPIAVTIDAKGSGYQVSKTLNGEETLVHRGQELTFNIDSVFPSFAEGTENRTVSITDMPKGQYVKDIKVYVGDMNAALELGKDYTLSTALPAKENESVTVNFTEAYIGTENEHAAKAIKVVVTTVVTDVENLKNDATGSHDDSPSTVTSETGSITINKVDRENNKLTGAKFSFKLHTDDTHAGEETLQFVKVSDGVYKLATPAEIADNAVEKVTELEVAAEGETAGTLVAKGLGEGIYHIEETKAPEGYSTVKVEDQTLALGENTQDITLNVINTKLSSLPSTGGIGTTIFTIGGCVIMVTAAGLYFATRKKEDK